MLANIIFCTAVLLATLAVVLLALVSPVPSHHSNHRRLTLSLYIQQPHVSNSPAAPIRNEPPGAFIFHHALTEGPRNTSRVIGKAQGFIIPSEHFAYSAFNVIYLSLDTAEYSGTVSVDAKQFGKSEELAVVGGTGSFAFARGVAVLAQPSHRTYHLRLRLRFPIR